MATAPSTLVAPPQQQPAQPVQPQPVQTQSFDLLAAQKAGYSDEEIANHLAPLHNFDLDSARKSGYSDREIINHLTSARTPDEVRQHLEQRYGTLMNPPQPEGFWAQLGHKLNPMSGPSLGGGDQPGAGPIGHAIQGIVGAHIHQGQEAADAWKRGEHIEALGHAGAAALPILGPLAGSIGNDIGNKDWAGIASTIASLGIGALATKIPGAVGKFTHAPPVNDLVKAYNISNPYTMDHLEAAAQDIKSVSGKHVLDNEDVLDHGPVAVTKQAHALEQFKAPARAMGVQVDLSPAIQATADALSPRLNPKQRLKAITEAQQLFGRPMSIDQTAAALKQVNAELNSWYKIPEGDRAALEMSGGKSGRSMAVLEAQAKVLRDQFYNALDPANGGAGPREINGRMGSTMALIDHATSARTKIAAEQAGSPMTKSAKALGSLLSIPGREITGTLDQAGGAGNVNQAVRGPTTPLIRRAFRNTGPAAPYPIPGASPRIAGLLPPPPIADESMVPADTSYVRGVHAMTQPPNPARALPPASTHFMPGQVPPGSTTAPGAYANYTDPVQHPQLPPASSVVGVSGTTVPDILGRSSRGAGSPQGLLPPPTPGNPPINVNPGTVAVEHSIGPAGPVPVTSSEKPIPLPKPGNKLGLDAWGKPVRPVTLNQAQRRALMEIINSDARAEVYKKSSTLPPPPPKR